MEKEISENGIFFINELSSASNNIRNMALNFAYNNSKLSKANVDCYEAGFKESQSRFFDTLCKGVEIMKNRYSLELNKADIEYEREYYKDDSTLCRCNKYNAILDKLEEAIHMIKQL
nr:MAG TPA: hypothetical protein [Crassvirales sp.]